MKIFRRIGAWLILCALLSCPAAPASAMLSPRQAGLLGELSTCVGGYQDSMQSLLTAPYRNNAEALCLVLAHDQEITRSALRYGLDKAAIQAVLFQEIRFYNLWDEVDHVVALSHFSQRNGGPVILRADSSTGLGQIYAATAIKALNWRDGSRLSVSSPDHMDQIWNRLHSDDAFNIDCAALILAHNNARAREELHIAAPTIRDAFRLYNGSGPAAERYADTVYSYYLAFQSYNQ